MLEKSRYYPGQQSQEEIVLFIRRHLFSYAKWIAIFLLLLIIPALIMSVEIGNGVIIIDDYSRDYFIIGLSAYLLFVMALFLTTWIEYYLNVTIVTKTHLIHIRQSELFTRSVSEQSLLRVQDVSSKVNGFFGNFLKFGSVYVETAGEEPNFILVDIPKPNAVANIIMEIHEELTAEREGTIDIAEGVGDIYQAAKEKRKKTVAAFEGKKDVHTHEGRIISIQKPKNNTINQTVAKKNINKADVNKNEKIIKIDKPIFKKPTKTIIDKKYPDTSDHVFDTRSNIDINLTKVIYPASKKTIEINENKYQEETLEGELKEGEEIRF